MWILRRGIKWLRVSKKNLWARFGMHVAIPGWTPTLVYMTSSHMMRETICRPGILLTVVLQPLSVQSMFPVGRYHAQLRRAFQVIDRAAQATDEELADTDLWNMSFDNILQMACKSVNDAVEPKMYRTHFVSVLRDASTLRLRN